MEGCQLVPALPGWDLIVPEAMVHPLVLMDGPSQGSKLTMSLYTDSRLQRGLW